MNYNTTHFVEELEKINVFLTDNQISQFLTFYEMLIEKNKVMNLTGITDFDEVIEKHFIDSISLARVVDCSNAASVLDLGTGAGFPGIPLKIAFPNLEITLVDSLNKRITFLNEVIDALKLDKIHTVHSRAEDLGRNKDYREKYDLCVSRAVANLSSLSEYCTPFIKVGGKFISYKGGDCQEEVSASSNAFRLLGCKVDDICFFELGESSRSLIVIQKEASTKKAYPRKAGTPTKEPL